MAAEAMAIMGPMVSSLRSVQLDTLRGLATAVHPVDVLLRAAMPTTVAKVASSKSPALMAALAATLRWTDFAQAACYVNGFPMIGDIPSSGTFRQLGAQSTDPPPKFFGQAAVLAVQDIENTPAPRNADTIWQLCQDDVNKGFASPPPT